VIVRRLSDVKTVEWGNGLSRRFLLATDGMGYSITDTIVWAGTGSMLHYTNHLEACYCISGKGEVFDASGMRHVIEPGTIYALDQHDAHYLVASDEEDLRLVCVFSPALQGDERHDLNSSLASHY
jgi:L-ectoine synthase